MCRSKARSYTHTHTHTHAHAHAHARTHTHTHTHAHTHTHTHTHTGLSCYIIPPSSQYSDHISESDLRRPYHSHPLLQQFRENSGHLASVHTAPCRGTSTTPATPTTGTFAPPTSSNHSIVTSTKPSTARVATLSAIPMATANIKPQIDTTTPHATPTVVNIKKETIPAELPVLPNSSPDVEGTVEGGEWTCTLSGKRNRVLNKELHQIRHFVQTSTKLP